MFCNLQNHTKFINLRSPKRREATQENLDTSKDAFMNFFDNNMRTAEGAVARQQKRKLFVDILLGLRIPTTLILAIIAGANAQKSYKLPQMELKLAL